MKEPAMPAFDKILIANRGEIACRLLETIHRLGFTSVAVYSEADANARHVDLADEAICIGGAAVGESYLNIDAIMDAAKKTGAQAIHPGYGFLSENADFAACCQAAGLCFIGPSIDAIKLMGSKRAAKIAMLAAGVPCIPGYEGDRQDDTFLGEQACRIGFPLMIKASAGGGGRGMRRVDTLEALAESLQRARSEAEHAFGNSEVILERAIDHARHIEIQVFGDSHGNHVYLGERDCSLQRRHQKVVEEAPSPAVTPRLRAAMGEAAIRAAKACDYIGAGTVEFLLSPTGEFYFLEMNTRLQVEHPVTEMITGEDLVEWQIRVAQGEPLPKRQEDITLKGHAIEVRLYAEDPAQQFLPQTGEIGYWQPAPTSLARTDHGLKIGTPVSRFYDPMLAKIICWGNTREDARRKLVRALKHTRLFGITHNKAFLLDLITTPTFRAGAATTDFIGDHYGPTGWQGLPCMEEAMILAAMVYQWPGALPPGSSHPGSTGQLRKLASRSVVLRHQTQQQTITLNTDNQGMMTCRMGDSPQATLARIVTLDGNRITYEWGHIRKQAHVWSRDNHIHLDLGLGPIAFEVVTHSPPLSQESATTGVLKAPMDGAVTAIMAIAGDTVKKGQTLLVIEAMKMEHLVKADLDGVVVDILVQPGQQVKGRQCIGNLRRPD